MVVRRPSFAVALLLGIFFIALVNVAVRHAELVTGRYVTGGVPPVAAFGALLLLLGVRAALRRFTRYDLGRDSLLIVYSMVALGTFLSGAYGVRAFLPHLITVHYWAEVGTLGPFIPAWLAPTDAEAIRQYFQGNHGQGTPWGLWLRPLLIWLTFWVALFGTGACLMLLARRPWLQHERLSFPLLTLPLALTAEEGEHAGLLGGRKLLRSPLLWMGIGAAALFDGLNIGHALRPAIPAPGFYVSLSDAFSGGPLAPFGSITLFFMLEAIGFGYFVPLPISFSMWFFYLLEKFYATGALAAGVEAPGLPFLQEQSAGAYLAMAALLILGMRRHLEGAVRRALLVPWRKSTPEDRELRLAGLGLALCAAYLLWFAVRAGLSPRAALPYFALLAGFLLVYARLRAETGVPFEFIYPYGLPRELLVQGLAATGMLGGIGPRSFAALSLFAWLSRHHGGIATAAHQIDALKLADTGGIARRRMLLALLVAFVFGLACACWSHLDAYYDLGSNVAGGGMGRGEYRAQVALQEFRRTAGQIKSPPQPDVLRLEYVGAGAGITLLLAGLRHYWLGCPFHPLGFILATAYGDSTTFFAPLFLAWLIKGLLLKTGGLHLYRAGLPFFLGLIIGHFSIAGIFWPLFSLLISPEASAGYHLYFG